MAEDLSPESKLYVKEELEGVRKEIREDLERVRSKSTRTFTAIAGLVGLLTCIGVYGLAVKYIDTAIDRGFSDKGVAELESKVRELVKGAEETCGRINDAESKAQEILHRMEEFLQPGIVAPFAGPIGEVPNGWLPCDGRELNTREAKYAKLYAAIGKAWGGGANTFRIPDLRGVFLRGVNHNRIGEFCDPGASARQAVNGGNAQDKVGSFQSGHLAQHRHKWAMTKPGTQDASLATWGPALDAKPTMLIEHHAHKQIPSGRGGKDDDSKIVRSIPGGAWTAPGEPVVVDDADAETRPKNAYVNFIIKI